MINLFAKILSIFFIVVFSMQQVFCFPVYTDEIDPEYVKSKNSEKVQFVMPVFEDETADSLSKELKKPKYISRNYVDIAFVNPVMVSGQKKSYVPLKLNDLPIRFSEEDKFFVKPVFNQNIAFDERIPVKVTACEAIMPVNKVVKTNIKGKTYYTNQESPLIGTRVKFKVKEDVYYKNELFIKKDTDVFAIVGRSVPSMLGGSSGEIQIDRFRTFDVDGNVVRLFGFVEKEGFSTAYLVYIAGLALAPFTFGASGLLVYMVPGLSAKISANSDYTLYYLPEQD